MKKGKEKTEQNKIIVFESKRIRRIWYNEEWYFSVVDVCGALTDSPNVGAYWRKLKQRLLNEGSEVVTFCHRLKLEAPDGKMRETDCANTEGWFRNFYLWVCIVVYFYGCQEPFPDRNKN